MAGWLRLYTEIRHDRKLRRLTPGQRWLWVVILTIAKESPQPGRLLLAEGVLVNGEDLADEAAIPIEEVESGIEAFIAQNMLEKIDEAYRLVNWDKRQFISDNSTDRWHAWKGKKEQTPDQQSTNVGQTLVKRPQSTEYRVQSTDINTIPQNSFNDFWKAYPKKKSKGQAEKVWKKINPDEQLLATMLAKIEQAKTSVDWTKENGKYIPYPATWLNAKGWEDEYEAMGQPLSSAREPTDDEKSMNELYERMKQDGRFDSAPGLGSGKAGVRGLPNGP